LGYRHYVAGTVIAEEVAAGGEENNRKNRSKKTPQCDAVVFHMFSKELELAQD